MFGVACWLDAIESKSKKREEGRGEIKWEGEWGMASHGRGVRRYGISSPFGFGCKVPCMLWKDGIETWQPWDVRFPELWTRCSSHSIEDFRG